VLLRNGTRTLIGRAAGDAVVMPSARGEAPNECWRHRTLSQPRRGPSPRLRAGASCLPRGCLSVRRVGSRAARDIYRACRRSPPGHRGARLVAGRATHADVADRVERLVEVAHPETTARAVFSVTARFQDPASAPTGRADQGCKRRESQYIASGRRRLETEGMLAGSSRRSPVSGPGRKRRIDRAQLAEAKREGGVCGGQLRQPPDSG
jgi:hypothetical protein